MKPISFTEVLELGALCETVFDHMVHEDTAGTIDPTIIEWRSDDFPPKVGSRNRLRGKFGPFKLRMTSEFIEVERPYRMVIRGVSPPMTRWTTGIHDLEPIDGGMRYTYTVEMRPPPGFRMVHRWLSRKMHRGVLEGCERLVATFGRPS